jgi:hypothetical protein
LWNVKKPLACSQQPSTCQHVPVRTSSSYFFLSHFSIAFTSIYLSQEISTIFSWKIFYSFCFLSKIFFCLDELKWQCVKRLLLCYEMLCIYLQLIVPLHWLNDWAAAQSYVGKNAILQPAQVICNNLAGFTNWLDRQSTIFLLSYGSTFCPWITTHLPHAVCCAKLTASLHRDTSKPSVSVFLYRSLYIFLSQIFCLASFSCLLNGNW